MGELISVSHFNQSDFTTAKHYEEEPPLFGCSKDMATLISIILQENNLKFPLTISDAFDLFVILSQEMDSLF